MRRGYWKGKEVTILKVSDFKYYIAYKHVGCILFHEWVDAKEVEII